jgi:hypothetical protein
VPYEEKILSIKMNKTIFSWLIGAFVWCIFMGVFTISIGFGALSPHLNYIAKPLTCPYGRLSFEQDVSNPIQGTTITTAIWYCWNPGTDIPIQIDPIKMALYAGPLYGLLFFGIGLAFWYMNTKWNSDKFIGKVIRRIEIGIGILVLVLLIIFPMWPLLKEFLPILIPTP